MSVARKRVERSSWSRHGAMAHAPPRFFTKATHDHFVVGVSFTIGSSGAVGSFAITRSSGDSDLDAAARSLVQGSRFPPPPGGSAHIATSFNYVPH